MRKVVCPKCEKDDQIQKISSLVTGGISTTNYKNSFGGIETAASQTRLSSRLSPPAKPKLGFVFAFAISMLLIQLFPVLCLLAAVAGGSNVTIGETDSNSYPAIVNIAGVALDIFMIYLAVNEYRKFQNATQNWKNQIARWGELYYCYRDDCVFNTESGKSTSPESISRLL